MQILLSIVFALISNFLNKKECNPLIGKLFYLINKIGISIQWRMFNVGVFRFCDEIVLNLITTWMGLKNTIF